MEEGEIQTMLFKSENHSSDPDVSISNQNSVQDELLMYQLHFILLYLFFFTTGYPKGLQ